MTVMPPPDCQRGFTLLEVVIAIALTALIGLGVASLVQQLVNARERFETPSPLKAEIEFARLVERRLEALVVRPVHEQGLLQFNQALDYRPDLQRLEWVSQSSAPLPMGDFYTRLRRQRLEWLPEPGRLTLSSTGLLDAAGTPQWQQVAALEGIDALALDFYHDGRWQAATPPEGESQGVRLTWQGAAGEITLMTQLPERAP